ncbi:hypothetical protein [Nannocystis punicea]|uniref:Uncharacterized protein n=1 Tax=Nannocystis punicea TaxID=2995304 RepID=A0ABY7H0K2_9BACT|nr:hypothetical protein [Nannocystis poenicansa]WAS92781.1 hypothetical protein O0S08_41935 [Nannocystis poenicansa]
MCRVSWLLALLVAGCLPPASESVLGGTAGGATTTVDAGSGTSTTSTTGTTSTGVTGDPPPLPDLAADSDMGPGVVACDIYAQDCPEGQKCAWTAPPGELYWAHTTCVPLSREPLPPGSPCQYDVDDPFTGVDDCDIGSACVERPYSPDPWDGEGACLSSCMGTAGHPYCDVGSLCVGGRAQWLCVPMCDPLLQDCAPGNRCDLSGGGTLCVGDLPDGPRVAVGEVCSWIDDCELGATCLGGAVPDCAGESCCTPFCDRSDPQAACPLPGQKCVAPWELSFEKPGAEAVGVCGTEALP